ncbi:MAG: cytochrome c peroxidase [Planctomycetota bacterium]
MRRSMFVAITLAAVLVLRSQAAGQARDVIPPGVPVVHAPVENPHSTAKALLGKVLFWDEQLSASGTMACGTCHLPEAGGSDPRTAAQPTASTHPGPDGAFGTADDLRGSLGVIRQLRNGSYAPAPVFGLLPQVTRRRAPSVLNAAFASSLFWDGRAEGVLLDPVSGAVLASKHAALEIQAAEPPVSSLEMAHAQEDWIGVAARIARASPLALAWDVPTNLAAFTAGRSYPDLFGDAFGTPAVTPARILFALATYQRTLISDQSRWDDYLAGSTTELSAVEQRGRDVFFGVGRCSQCHHGQLLSDGKFHDLGIRPDGEDLGRGAVTGRAEDFGRFRTPSLRNVALRAPYFHTGRFDTLGDVVSFYDDGGDFEADPLIQRLRLSPSQRLALVAFMQALTDPRVAAGAPPFDRPKLFTESTFAPQPAGAGSAGWGGFTPGAIVVEPALTTSREYSLGVRRAAPGALALLAIDAASAASPIPLLGAQFHLGWTPALTFIPAGPLVVGVAGTGHGTLSFDLAAAGVASGIDVWLQWLIADAAAVGGLAASDAVQVRTL